jgi:hypothetical protein
MAVNGLILGLVGFYVAARPTSASRAVATATGWAVTGATVGLVILVAWLAARLARPTMKATWFALAAGSAEAIMAVLSKAFGDKVGDGVVGAFASWEPYVLVLVGVATLLVVQSAYQVDRATVTLPVIAVSEPLISVVIGAALFGERIRLGVVHGIATAGALVLMVGCLVPLARASGSTAARGDGAL